MTPLKLKLENFGAYADAELNFDFNAALIQGEHTDVAGGSNGSGKSLIFQALTWVLTGNSKFKNSIDIIRRGSEQTRVTLWFDSGAESYRLMRGRNRANKVQLELTRLLPDGKEERVNADTNSLLDEKVAAVTKITYDAFVNTNYFAQNSISEFMYGTSSVRQKLVAEILSMDRWNRYAELANERLKQSEKTLDLLRFKKTDLAKAVGDKHLLAAHLYNAERLLAVVQPQIVEISGKLEVVRSKLAAAQQTAKAVEMHNLLQNQLGITKNTLSQRRTSREQLDAEIARMTAEKTDLVELSKVVEEKKPQETSAGMDSMLAEGRARLALARQHLAAMQAGKCSHCGFNWASPDAATKLAEQASEVERINTKLSERISKYNSLRAAEEAYAKQKAGLESRLSRIDASLPSATVRLTEITKEIGGLEQQIAKLSTEVAKTAVTEVVDTKSLSEEEATLHNELKSKNSIRDAELSDIARVTVQIQETARKESELASVSAELGDLEKQVGLLTNIAKHFGKSGVQATILDSVIGELEATSNKYLAKFTYKPTIIRFVTQKIDTKGQPKETLDVEIVTPTGTSPFDSLSGGEQFRVAFAIRLALSSIQAKRAGGELQLLLLDEVSSSLDKNGLETFVGIIKELQKSMKVMVITHDDALKEHFSSIILVRNKDGIATVIQ